MNLGQFGEDKAAGYLISQGYTVLCRNFRYKRGEIDIVARDRTRDDLIIFFEVKTRRNRKFGLPCEAVTNSKMRKIRNAIRMYSVKNNCVSCDLRVDVIEILLMNQKIYLRHLKNIF